jgi:formylglycine-generating enzyme required for sulfatase activity
LDNAETVIYQLAESEYRSRLLERVPTLDRVVVIEQVSSYVVRGLNTSISSFRALLCDPRRAALGTAEGDRAVDFFRAFATVTADVLRGLGSQYDSFVESLERGEVVTPAIGDGGLDLLEFESEVAVFERDNTPELEAFEYESVETLGVLKQFEFETATIAIEEVGIGRTVAKLENVSESEDVTESEDSEPEVSPNPKMPSGVEMVEFDYTVVTLNPDGSERERYAATTTGFKEFLGMSVELDMLAIPSGEFFMGAPVTESGSRHNERPQHSVKISEFYMSRVPVTQSQWRIVASLPRIKRDLKPEPSRFNGDNRPVEMVSWDDAVEFCSRLSAYTQYAYRLPSEAEWEYVCRAGTETPFHFGEALSTDIANYGNNFAGTTSVDLLKAANAWGLSDMHGNIWEWCQDDWHENYDRAPRDGNAWSSNSSKNRKRVVRGGCWYVRPQVCRSAYRYRTSRVSYRAYVGFRVACSAPRLS